MICKVSGSGRERPQDLVGRARHRLTTTALGLIAVAACQQPADIARDTKGLTTGAGAATGVGGSGATGGSTSAGMGGTEMGLGGSGAMGGTVVINPSAGQSGMEKCPPTTCAEQGYECGSIVDACGKVTNCADEGFTCGPLEACVGGVDAPAKCMVGGEPCELCASVPDCSKAGTMTAITGRVITPGRDDANTGNQVGVPNAFVYILRNKGVDELPAITSGIPENGTSCDRCEDQDLGPLLLGTVTDATGAFKLEGNVPVGDEFTMVVKAGRFRRAFPYTVPESAACQTTALPTTLPDNPARLPRSMSDGLAVNIPRIAVTTGSIDAMECVLEKMGISHDEFKNPGTAGDDPARIHMYQGRSNADVTKGDGARIDANTPLEDVLYGDPKRLTSYDIVLADCEGASADSSSGVRGGGPMGQAGGGPTGQAGMANAGPGQPTYNERDEFGENVINYVNRGGRMFVSHLRYTWLYGNGMQAYDAADPLNTGLDAAAVWDLQANTSGLKKGNGIVSVGRPGASPRIQSFADWANAEMVASPPGYAFEIAEPRSQAGTLGMSSEEFVYTDSIDDKAGERIQQFSFNTPYASPADAACGRVAYSGFHVSVGMTDGTTFPSVCGTGDLTKQEKVLLYMLFDLATCVGDTPPPPACTPQTCDDLMVTCGFTGDGCGKVLDCGPCPLPIPK